MVTRFGVPANAMSASRRMITAKVRKEMGRIARSSLVFSLLLF